MYLAVKKASYKFKQLSNHSKRFKSNVKAEQT